MHKSTVIGNIGGDARIQNINGREAINFSIADNREWKDKDGNKHKDVFWVNCTYWRPQGQTAIAEYLKSGVQVYVEGIPSWSIYQGKNGQAVDFKLSVTSLQLLSSPAQKSENNSTAAPQQQYSAPEQQSAAPIPPSQEFPQSQNDDLPF